MRPIRCAKFVIWLEDPSLLIQLELLVLIALNGSITTGVNIL